jgi:hypothetical protein
LFLEIQILVLKSPTSEEKMAEDTSSATSSNAIPFPTLTILYLPSEASEIVEEISQKYSNMTTESCKGYFHGGKERQYWKVTIWSQGIDSLWFNAIIARVKDLADVNSIPIVSGGIMYAI